MVMEMPYDVNVLTDFSGSFYDWDVIAVKVAMHNIRPVFSKQTFQIMYTVRQVVICKIYRVELPEVLHPTSLSGGDRENPNCTAVQGLFQSLE